MSSLFSKKQGLSFVLMLMLAFTTISSALVTVVNAEPASTGRREKFIELAKGKNASEISDISQLTAEDMRILGVFLSNFYVPWQTKLNSPDETENQEASSNMIDALVKNCGFDEDLSKQIVEYVWNISLSRDNVKELKVAEYSGGSVGTTVSKGGESKSASYDEMLYYIGGCSLDFNNPNNIFAGTDKRFCLYWADSSGSKHVVMESFNDNDMTPSAFSYGLALGGVDYASGIGSSLTSADNEDDATKVGKDKGEDFVSKWLLYVDTFGNILVDCGKSGQYVVLPACLSAYTWTDSSGTAGQQVPLVNLLSIGNTTFDGQSSSSLRISYNKSSSRYEFGVNGDLFRSCTDFHWRAYRTQTDNHFYDSYIGADLAEYAQSEKVHNVRNNWNGEDDYFPTWDKFYKSYSNDSNLSVIDDLVYIDNLSAFKQGGSILTTLNQDAGIFSTDTKDADSGNTYYQPLKDFREGYASSNFYSNKNGSKFIANSDTAKSVLVEIYLSYVLAFEGDSKVSYRFNSAGLPPLSSPTAKIFDITQSSEDSQLKQIKSMIYYLLHPKEGTEYIKQLFKTKTSAILVGIHEGIVGQGSSANVGITRYVGFSGYVTTPELRDLSWTSLILDKYDSIFVFMIIAVILLLVGYVMIGSLSFQKAFIGIGIFAICAYLPPTVIDATVGISNKASTAIYGKKFIYWALVQHQTYSEKISESATADSYDDYLVTLYNENAGVSNGSSTSVSLKWMCPKKNNYMFSVEKELESVNSNQYALLKPALGTQLSGQTFLDSKGANYLYRSYTDINNYSKFIYANMKNRGTPSIANGVASVTDIGVADYYNSLDASYGKGFSVMNSKGRRNSTDTDSPDMTKINLRWRPLYTSSDMKDALSKKVSDATLSSYLGISQDKLDYDISSINKLETVNTACGLDSFVQYTESPFYYFSWNYYDQGMSATQDGSTGAFKDLMLGNLTGGKDSYFYNTKASDSSYGEMKDYLDMKTLFTVVIPYLKNANDEVVSWDNTYGLSTYEGISCDPSKPLPEGSSDEDKYKKWHNVNVAQLWNMYSPWIDTMYDCSYANKEKIEVAGKTVIVEDPLDPRSYPGESEGRPMIFSRSEMRYWGISEKDLTQVESRILQVQDDTMADLYYMMNYYTFDDNVLNTASAMLTTFNFNSTFSENGLLSGSKTLQPQSFELKNFSYDAYLRMIMANATGESLLSESNLYETIIEHTSVVTGGLLIVNDILACYLTSGLKLFFLIGIFFMSVIMILVATIRLELNLLKTVWGSLLLPLLKFLAVSVAHALVVSFFMSDGNINITGESSTSISLGDPTLTLALMILVNAVVVFLYYKIVRSVAKDLVKYTKAVASSVSGMAGGLATGLVGGALLSRAGGVSDGVNGTADFVGNRIRNHTTNKANRASIRASKSARDYYDSRLKKSSSPSTSRSTRSDIDRKISRGRAKHTGKTLRKSRNIKRPSSVSKKPTMRRAGSRGSKSSK